MPAQGSTARSLLGAGLGLVGFSAIAGLLVTVMVAPAIAVTGMTANNSINVFQDLPDYITIDKQHQRNTIVAINADGSEVQVAEIFDQNREEVSLDSIDDDLKWAAVDGEDRRFFEHGGVDVPSLVRAAIGQITDTSSSGASTLTMQLVRNILIQKAVNTPITKTYTKDDYNQDIYDATYPNLNRKLKEMKLAIAMEKKYTKDEILEGYLNIVLMGNTTYGVEAGAQRYFGTTAKDVTPAQAASLIAIVQNPAHNGLGDPKNFADNKARRDVILGWMYAQKHLTKEQYDEALATPVDETTVSSNPPKSGCTSAPVELRLPCDYALKSILNGEVPSLGATKDQQLDTWKKGGLKVVLTVAPDLQAVATNTAAQFASPTETRMKLGAGVATVQPGTGRILVMAQNKTFDDTGQGDPQTTTAINLVGDEDHGGSSGYQPGSTYKPYTLLAFLTAGHGLNETFDAGVLQMQQSLFLDTCGGPTNGPWSTLATWRNDSNERGLYNVTRGTAGSVNSVFMQMASEIDQCSIRNIAQSLGVHRGDGAPDGSDLWTRPSCVLGGCENNIAPLTQAAAYAAIANQGVYCKPIIIEKFMTADGGELPGQSADCGPSLVTPNVAHTAVYAMQAVITGGTGSASNPRDGTPYFGKTGTTNDAIHTWMVGASKGAATAVWVGNIEGKQSMRRISVNGVYGGDLRHRIFKPIAQAIDKRFPGGAFAGPDPALMIGTPVIVPDNLIGLTPEQAKTTIELAKLSYVDGGQMDSDLPVGTVVKVDPGSGASVPKGSGVTVYTSNGQAVMVPDVVSDHQNYNDARDELQDAGFDNVPPPLCKVGPALDPDLGKVVAQDPSAGAVVNKNTTIKLTVLRDHC